MVQASVIYMPEKTKQGFSKVVHNRRSSKDWWRWSLDQMQNNHGQTGFIFHPQQEINTTDGSSAGWNLQGHHCCCQVITLDNRGRIRSLMRELEGKMRLCCKLLLDRTKWAQVRQNNNIPVYFQCVVFPAGQSNYEPPVAGFWVEVFKPTL